MTVVFSNVYSFPKFNEADIFGVIGRRSFGRSLVESFT